MTVTFVPFFSWSRTFEERLGSFLKLTTVPVTTPVFSEAAEIVLLIAKTVITAAARDSISFFDTFISYLLFTVSEFNYGTGYCCLLSHNVLCRLPPHPLNKEVTALFRHIIPRHEYYTLHVFFVNQIGNNAVQYCIAGFTAVSSA